MRENIPLNDPIMAYVCEISVSEICNGQRYDQERKSNNGKINDEILF